METEQIQTAQRGRGRWESKGQLEAQPCSEPLKCVSSLIFQTHPRTNKESEAQRGWLVCQGHNGRAGRGWLVMPELCPPLWPTCGGCWAPPPVNVGSSRLPARPFLQSRWGLALPTHGAGQADRDSYGAAVWGCHQVGLTCFGRNVIPTCPSSGHLGVLSQSSGLG